MSCCRPSHVTVVSTDVTTLNHRPNVKKKLFTQAASSSRSLCSPPTSRQNNSSTELKPVSVSLNKLSVLAIQKLTHRDREGTSADKGSRRGCAVEMESLSEGETDDERGGWEKGKGRWGSRVSKGGRAPKKISSLLDGLDCDTSPDFVPRKKRTVTKSYNKVNQPPSSYMQPDQKVRGTQLSSFRSVINDTTLSHCQHILNVPLSCSGDHSEDPGHETGHRG